MKATDDADAHPPASGRAVPGGDDARHYRSPAGEHVGVSVPEPLCQATITRRSVIKAGVMASGSFIISASYIGPSVETVSLRETLSPSIDAGAKPKPSRQPRQPKPSKP